MTGSGTSKCRARARLRSRALRDRRCRRRAASSWRSVTVARAAEPSRHDIRRALGHAARRRVLDADDRDRPVAAVARRGRESRVTASESGTLPRARDRRHDAAVDESDIGRREMQRRKGVVGVRDESASTLRGCDTRCRPAATKRRRLAGADDRPAAPGHERQHAASRVGAASAMSLAGFDVTRFIALTSGNGASTPNSAHDLAGARAGRIQRDPRAHFHGGVRSGVSRTRMPATRPPSLIASIASTWFASSAPARSAAAAKASVSRSLSTIW